MFEKVKWLFFDMGSTLVDEQSAIEHRLREIARRANTTYVQVYQDTMRLYKKNRRGDKEIAKQLGVEMPKWFSEDERLYETVPSCLSVLKDKYKIGIIANQPEGTKERLKEYGILQYIDLIIASAEEGVAKPDQRIFEIALERSNCKANEAVMIGDRIDNDIVPAKLLGMYTIWVKQGLWQNWSIKSPLEKADYQVDRIEEICHYL